MSYIGEVLLWSAISLTILAILGLAIGLAYEHWIQQAGVYDYRIDD